MIPITKIWETAQATRATHLGEWWWGYVHINMSLQVKRQIDGSYFNIKAREELDSILYVFQPFYATDRQDAINKLDHEYMAFLKSYQEM